MKIDTTKEKLLEGLKKIESSGGSVDRTTDITGFVSFKGVEAAYNYSDILGELSISISDMPALASRSYVEGEINKFFEATKKPSLNPQRSYVPTKRETKEKKYTFVQIYLSMTMLFTIMFYLCGSFSQASFDIQAWSEESRNMTVMFYGMVMFMFAPMVAAEKGK